MAFENKKPTLKPTDVHIIVNDFESKATSEMKAYSAAGKPLWNLPCLARGSTADYSVRSGDTPPGLYKLGALTVTQDWENLATWMAFGKYFIDLVGTQQNEERFGRSGCGVHGGGTALGAKGSQVPYQPLTSTHGCIRVRNADMANIIVPLYEKVKRDGGTVWLTVNQY